MMHRTSIGRSLVAISLAVAMHGTLVAGPAKTVAPPSLSKLALAMVFAPLPDGRHTFGPGRYETLVEIGRVDGEPLLTFTSPHGADHVPHNPPSPAYLEHVRAGLRESRGWDDGEIDAYVDRLVRQGRPSAR